LNAHEPSCLRLIDHCCACQRQPPCSAAQRPLWLQLAPALTELCSAEPRSDPPWQPSSAWQLCCCDCFLRHTQQWALTLCSLGLQLGQHRSVGYLSVVTCGRDRTRITVGMPPPPAAGLVRLALSPGQRLCASSYVRCSAADALHTQGLQPLCARCQPSKGAAVQQVLAKRSAAKLGRVTRASLDAQAVTRGRPAAARGPAAPGKRCRGPGAHYCGSGVGQVLWLCAHAGYGLGAPWQQRSAGPQGSSAWLAWAGAGQVCVRVRVRVRVRMRTGMWRDGLAAAAAAAAVDQSWHRWPRLCPWPRLCWLAHPAASLPPSLPPHPPSPPPRRARVPQPWQAQRFMRACTQLLTGLPQHGRRLGAQSAAAAHAGRRQPLRAGRKRGPLGGVERVLRFEPAAGWGGGWGGGSVQPMQRAQAAARALAGRSTSPPPWPPCPPPLSSPVAASRQARGAAYLNCT
jgi:hypothetical protein